jgi:putative oxidoreductase
MNQLKLYFPAVVRITLGALFAYAAILKISDPVTFAGSVAAYQILPYFWNYVAAAVLPFVELFCGLLLISGYRVKSAALLITAMNLVFMAALASTIVRGLDIDCGCFKQGGEKTSAWVAIARDSIFLAMCFVILKLDPKARLESASAAGATARCAPEA